MAVASSIVTIGTTPTLIARGGSTTTDLKTVLLRNDSGVDIFLGGSNVTTANGLRLPTATAYTIDLGPQDDIYGCVAAATQSLQVLALRS